VMGFPCHYTWHMSGPLWLCDGFPMPLHMAYVRSSMALWWALHCTQSLSTEELHATSRAVHFWPTQSSAQQVELATVAWNSQEICWPLCWAFSQLQLCTNTHVDTAQHNDSIYRVAKRNESTYRVAQHNECTMVPTTLLKSISVTFTWLFQTKLMLFHDYFYTCNAQKNQKVGAQIYTECELSGHGYFPASGGMVWGGGCAPSPENVWDFCLKMAHFGCIFAIREISICLVYFCSSRIFFRKQMVKIPWLFHDSLNFPWLSMTC